MITNNIIKYLTHFQFDKHWHQARQPGCSIKVFTENEKYSSVEVTANLCHEVNIDHLIDCSITR